MKKILQWLKDFWYLPFLCLGSILAWIIFRKMRTPLSQTQIELKAIEAGRRARELETELGAVTAKLQILAEYKEAIAVLDEEEQTLVREIGNDPIALAKLLIKVSANHELVRRNP